MIQIFSCRGNLEGFWNNLVSQKTHLLLLHVNSWNLYNEFSVFLENFLFLDLWSFESQRQFVFCHCLQIVCSSDFNFKSIFDFLRLIGQMKIDFFDFSQWSIFFGRFLHFLKINFRFFYQLLLLRLRSIPTRIQTLVCFMLNRNRICNKASLAQDFWKFLNLALTLLRIVSAKTPLRGSKPISITTFWK